MSYRTTKVKVQHDGNYTWVTVTLTDGIHKVRHSVRVGTRDASTVREARALAEEKAETNWRQIVGGVDEHRYGVVIDNELDDPIHEDYRDAREYADRRAAYGATVEVVKLVPVR